MSKIKLSVDCNDVVYGVSFVCPGCNKVHWVNIIDKDYFGNLWGFTGTPEKPTILPSISNTKEKPFCHCWIRDGKISFSLDSQHDLCGKTVELPEYGDCVLSHIRSDAPYKKGVSG